MASRVVGWALTRRIFAAVVAASALWLGLAGTGELAVRAWVTATAHASAALFVLAFGARPLQQLAPNAAGAWLLANRRYVGTSAALTMAVHAVSIATLARLYPAGFTTDAVTVIVGGAVMALYLAMGLTSNDVAVAWLGRRAWKRLHTIGGWGAWLVFTTTIFGRVPGHAMSTALFAALVAVLALRVAARVRARSLSSA
jgi:hypothetical protein